MPVRDANAPFFVAIHSFDVDPMTGDLTLWLLGADGMRYSFTLSSGVVPALLTCLIGLSDKIKAAAPIATGQWENLQAVTVQSIRAIEHESGLVGLELQTAQGLALPILFDRTELPRLRESIDQLG
jgi:hypothetical protein